MHPTILPPVMDLNIYRYPGHLHNIKHKQPYLGFELGLLSLFSEILTCMLTFFL